MISTAWIIVLSIYFVFSLLMVIKVLRIYSKLSFLSKTEINHSSEFPGFTRDDFSNWNRFHLFIGGFFLVPIRMILAVVILTLTYIFQITLSIMFCTFSFNQGVNRCHKFLSNLLITIACRTLLFIGGVHWITYKSQKPMDYNLEYFNNLGEVPHAVYVSNHISWADILFYLGKPKPIGFISNATVENYCFVGKIAQLIQCIFVDRRSKESKQKCFEDLKERSENLKKNPKGNKFFFNLN